MKIKGNPHTVAELAPHRNAIQIAFTRGGIVVKKWPKKRGRAAQGYALWHQKEFGYAARYAARADPLSYETAKNWTDGTSMVPRDMLTMAALGLGLEFTDEEGNVYRSWRVTNPNPQIVLDLITEDPGSMLFRSPQLWSPLAPGLPGTTLRIGEDGLPTWEPDSEHFNLTTATTLKTGTAGSGAAFAFKGTTFTPFNDMYIGAIAVLMSTMVTGNYRACCALLSSNGNSPTLNTVTLGPIRTRNALANNSYLWLPFDQPVLLTQNNYYALMIGRTDGASNYALPIAAGGTLIHHLGPINGADQKLARLAQTTPAVGQTLDTNTGAAPDYVLSVDWF